jgi:hypothetical protein
MINLGAELPTVFHKTHKTTADGMHTVPWLKIRTPGRISAGRAGDKSDANTKTAAANRPRKGHSLPHSLTVTAGVAAC